MTRFRETFSNRHVVLPVIHLKSFEQALRNAELAQNAGADGVFLINHSIGRKTGHRYLYEIHKHLKERLPDFWMGVNCLNLYPEEVFNTAPDAVQGVWADNAGIDENAEEQLIARDVDYCRHKRQNMLYFGGVAFKYQNPVFDLVHVAQIAIKHMDVVTTSGKGTGWAAEIAKIEKMKQAVGVFPLAIASGITPENVKNYLPIADCFLVATGISKNFYEFDADKIQQLVEIIRKGC